MLTCVKNTALIMIMQFFLPCFRMFSVMVEAQQVAYSGRTSSLAPSLSMSLVIFSGCTSYWSQLFQSKIATEKCLEEFTLQSSLWYISYTPAWCSICTIQKICSLISVLNTTCDDNGIFFTTTVWHTYVWSVAQLTWPRMKHQAQFSPSWKYQCGGSHGPFLDKVMLNAGVSEWDGLLS